MKTKAKSTTKPLAVNNFPSAVLPDGVDNFYELITQRNEEGQAYLFVDKSLFIREFINSGTKVTLITRPRRFGKTLTLSMLQHFLAGEVEGKSTKGLFDGLKISQCPEIMEDQGQSPVIFLTLKEAKGKTYEEIFGIIKNKIKVLYETHSYLLTSSKLLDSQKEYFQKILHKTADDADYKTSLCALSQYLYEHTGKQVYVLLDEYDTPINDAYVHKCYEDCRSFLASMFGFTFKGNNYLKQGLITGILKIAKASLLTDLSNLQVYTMLDDALYTQYFGFTEEETDDFLNSAGLPQKAHQLKEMYNGYNLEGYTLYNPFSIVSFSYHLLLQRGQRIEKALKPYWINTGGTHLIGHLIEHNLFKLKNGLTSLLNGQPIKTFINENIVFNPRLKRNPSAFWSILFLSGYLKNVKEEIDEFGNTIYTLSYPNEEVRLSMRELLMNVSFGMEESSTMLRAMTALANGDVNTFIEFVEEYIRYTLSYFDKDKYEKEKPYHMLMLGMLAFFSNSHHVRSNRESGKGRYDISLIPKKAGKKGIVIETKAAKKGEKLEHVAKEALQQIKDEQYITEMAAHGVTDYVLLGLAFYGKEMAYACESST